MKRKCEICKDEQDETPQGIHGWYMVMILEDHSYATMVKFNRPLAIGDPVVCGMTCLLKYISQEMSWR